MHVAYTSSFNTSNNHSTSTQIIMLLGRANVSIHLSWYCDLMAPFLSSLHSDLVSLPYATALLRWLLPPFFQIIDMTVTPRCYNTAISQVVVLGSRSPLPPPLPRLSCRNRLRSQASVVFSQTARNQDALCTTPWTMTTTVIMVIVKALVFAAAVIGLVGNVDMAVSPAGGESSQHFWGSVGRLWVAYSK